MKTIHKQYNLNVLLIIFILLLFSCKNQQTMPAIDEQNTPSQYEGKIIAVGDSLTAGLGVGEAEAWPALLEKHLQNNGINWQVINAGISGETSSGTLSRIKWIMAQKPDVVIVETGANDGLRGIQVPVIMENIRMTVQLLQENEITVVLAGMQIVQNLGPEYTSAFTRIYPVIAEERECILIPFLLLDVAGEPSLNQSDSIHPNSEGHKTIARTVYPYIIKAIQEN